MQEKFIKAIATILVIVIICIQSSTSISYAVENLLSIDELENQNIKGENIDFDVYYEDGKHTKQIDLYADNNLEEFIYTKINLKDIGYIEDGIIDFSKCNFKVYDYNNQEIIKKIEDNKVILNRLTGGEEILIKLGIKIDDGETVSTDFFDKDNKIEFKGTFIDEKEKETSCNCNVILHTNVKVKNVETYINQTVSKYIPFSFNDESGVLLQTIINTGVKENKLPVKTSHIEVKVPTISDTLPEKIYVFAQDKLQEQENLSSENWNYNKETGLIIIDLLNKEDEDEKILWNKNVSDNINIVYVYPNSVFEKIYQTETNINLQAKVDYEFYYGELKDSKESDNTFSVKDQIGSLIDVTSKFNTEKINKGYLYNNLVASEENKKETIYVQEYELNISDTTIVDSIIINQQNDIFINDYDKNEEGKLKNKNIKFSKNDFLNIFGENGNITLKINENELSLNANSELDQNGNISINLDEYEGNIEVITSKPINAGILKINIEKAIEKEQLYSLEELKTFKELWTNTKVSVKVSENEIVLNKNDNKVDLEEPLSKFTAQINKENLSTVVANENVEINATLETNSIDDMLYKNPKLLMVFPSYVTGIEITNCKLLHSDEVKISSIAVEENQNQKVIIINMEGIQTLYNDDTTQGINVVLNANIEVDKLTPSVDDNISIYYLNENDSSKSCIDIPIKFIAPIELVTVNKLDNITIVNDENNASEEKAIITTYSNEKVTNVDGIIINNFNNSISNVKILGRIPNTDIEGNTFNVELQNEIKINYDNAKIYYSASANATEDLNDAQNGWVEGKVNYKNVKSFLIIIEDTLNKGTKLEFDYTLKIPENLSFNNQTKLGYKVSYNNNDISGVKKETRDSGIINITTGSGPNLEVNVEIDDAIDRQLKQGQYARFTATIKNIGTDATGVKVAIDETYGEVKKYNDAFEFEDDENVIKIGSLNAGETRTINYILQVNENAGISENAEFKVGATADGINSVIVGNKNIKINDGKLLLQNVIIASKAEDGNAQIIKGENASCGLYIKNITDESLENVTIRYKVGNEISIKEAGEVETFYSPLENLENANISSNGHVVTYVIDKIEANQSKLVRLNIEAIDVGTNVEFTAGALVTLNGENWSVNANTQSLRIKEYKAEIKSLKIDSKNQEKKIGEEVTYLYSVKNTGDLIVSMGNLNVNLPEGLDFKKAEIVSKINGVNIFDETIESIEGNIFNYTKTFLEVGEEVFLRIIAEVNDFSDENIKEKELSAKLKFTAMGIEKESESEVYYAVCDNDENAYKISGKVWSDANKNSKKDAEEDGVEGVTVVLFEKNTMNILTDSNGNEITSITSKEGTYEFKGLKNGKYLVAYLYNSEDYELSQYQIDDVLENQNSDATNRTAQYNGEEKIIALTDVIEINNLSERNVDLGLIQKDKFDLNLVKEINKVTVNDNGSVNETNFQNLNTQLAQIKVNANSDGSKTLIAEYKVSIRNDGNVSGYVNKIVSYLSDDMKFNSEINPDWYLGEDGNAYSTALVNYELQPGETKELTLILTKTIDNSKLSVDAESNDIINSKSEITEEYNEKGIVSIKEFNAKERNATASIEIVRKDNTSVIVTVTLLIIAMTIISGFIVYINKEKIANNNFYTRVKNILIK